MMDFERLKKVQVMDQKKVEVLVMRGRCSKDSPLCENETFLGSNTHCDQSTRLQQLNVSSRACHNLSLTKPFPSVILPSVFFCSRALQQDLKPWPAGHCCPDTRIHNVEAEGVGKR